MKYFESAFLGFWLPFVTVFLFILACQSRNVLVAWLEVHVFSSISLVNLQTGRLLEESNQEAGHIKAITLLWKAEDGSHFLSGPWIPSIDRILTSFFQIFS